MLSYFAKQRRKETREIIKETDSSKPTSRTSASQSIDFDSAKERINSNRPNIALDDTGISNILPFNISNNAFCPVEEHQ